ncbi:MAG: right-handed parallel beta-helix repeat-containing protein [bacterium]
MRHQAVVWAVLTAGLFSAPPSDAIGATLRVPAEYQTINAALDASASGDTVLVAPGTYTDSEVRGSGFTHRSCAFMVDGVLLRSEAGPDVTVIDMQNAPGPQASVVECEGLPSETTAIEGFTLTGAPEGGTGAWVVGVGRMSFRNCIFRDLDAGASTGGGLAGNGDVDVIDCEFVNCLATSGGGLIHSGGHLNLIGTSFRGCGNKGAYLLGVAGGVGESALIEDCVFLDNWSDNAAGGLHISQYNLGAVVRRCRFEGNQAYGSGPGGLAWGNFGPKLVEDCLFLNNAVSGDNGQGGGLATGGNGSCEVRGNTFYGNSQTYAFFGGASAFLGSGTIFEGNLVVGSQGNTAIEGDVVSGCNVFWDNPEGIGIPLSATDREIDPLFCDLENHDFTVRENSPCVEPGSLGCGQIGAFGAGCGIVSVDPSSWSRIKSSYRNGERP